MMLFSWKRRGHLVWPDCRICPHWVGLNVNHGNQPTALTAGIVDVASSRVMRVGKSVERSSAESTVL